MPAGGGKPAGTHGERQRNLCSESMLTSYSVSDYCCYCYCYCLTAYSGCCFDSTDWNNLDVSRQELCIPVSVAHNFVSEPRNFAMAARSALELHNFGAPLVHYCCDSGVRISQSIFLLHRDTSDLHPWVYRTWTNRKACETTMDNYVMLVPFDRMNGCCLYSTGSSMESIVVCCSHTV